jgi:hypothetical protein
MKESKAAEAWATIDGLAFVPHPVAVSPRRQPLEIGTENSRQS